VVVVLVVVVLVDVDVVVDASGALRALVGPSSRLKTTAPAEAPPITSTKASTTNVFRVLKRIPSLEVVGPSQGGDRRIRPAA